MDNQLYGTVIVFNKTATREEIERQLNALIETGLINRYQLRKFNPDHGGPVWYIP